MIEPDETAPDETAPDGAATARRIATAWRVVSVALGLALAAAPGVARAGGSGDGGEPGVAPAAAGDGAGGDPVAAVAASDRGDWLATIGRRALRRFRRSITVGPFVGVAPAVSTSGGDFDVQLSFGLALERYAIPIVPTPERIQEILLDRVKSEFVRRLAELSATGREVTEADRERLARQIWEDIKAEFLLELRPRRLERPSFGVRFEVGRLQSAEVWDVRFMVGIGVLGVMLSAGSAVAIDDGAKVAFAFELSKPVLLTRGLRAPVVEPFVRGDFAVNGREDRGDLVLFGARFVLDAL